MVASRSRRASSAATIAHIASSMNADASEPVRSFNAPMSAGPTNPPTLAIVTTNAMPAAAGAPLRNRVGIDQNGPYAAQCPTGTSVNEKSANNGSRKKAQPKNPAPMTSNGTATCNGRSSVRSEWALFNTMQMIVAALIAPKIRPTSRSLLAVSDLMISGAQNEY